MIEAKNLRLNNWVSGTENYAKYPSPLQVVALMNDEVYTQYKDDIDREFYFDRYGEPSHSHNEVFGIPLTTVILLECGFQLFPWGYVKKSEKDFGVRLSVKSFSYEVSGNNPVNLKYLHQLQNLYYSLTGEELNIQL